MALCFGATWFCALDLCTYSKNTSKKRPPPYSRMRSEHEYILFSCFYESAGSSFSHSKSYPWNALLCTVRDSLSAQQTPLAHSFGECGSVCFSGPCILLIFRATKLLRGVWCNICNKPNLVYTSYSLIIRKNYGIFITE